MFLVIVLNMSGLSSAAAVFLTNVRAELLFRGNGVTRQPEKLSPSDPAILRAEVSPSSHLATRLTAKFHLLKVLIENAFTLLVMFVVSVADCRLVLPGDGQF